MRSTVSATVRYRWTVRARLMFWTCKVAARLGIPIDLGKAAKAIIDEMSCEVR